MNKDKLILVATTAIIVVCLFFMVDRKGIGEPLGKSKKLEVKEPAVSKLEEVSYRIESEDENKAADFSLKNLRGEDVSLSQFRGKLVFINFWVTWNEESKQELKNLERLVVDNEDVKVLCVNVREDKSLVEKFVADNEIGLDILLDENGEIGLDYLIGRLPTTYIVDKTGRIVNKVIGHMTYEEMFYELENNL